MTISKKIIVTILATLLLAVIVYVQLSDAPPNRIEMDKNLVHAIDDCSAIADKSVAHMVAIVDFQKLEIAGRRIKVLRQCMQDMGYQEDPRWTGYATPLAQLQAKSQNISADEAIEILRREHMARIRIQENIPIYWKTSQTSLKK